VFGKVERLVIHLNGQINGKTYLKEYLLAIATKLLHPNEVKL